MYYWRDKFFIYMYVHAISEKQGKPCFVTWGSTRFNRDRNLSRNLNYYQLYYCVVTHNEKKTQKVHATSNDTTIFIIIFLDQKLLKCCSKWIQSAEYFIVEEHSQRKWTTTDHANYPRAWWSAYSVNSFIKWVQIGATALPKRLFTLEIDFFCCEHSAAAIKICTE